MAAKESELITQFMLEASKLGHRLFRFNSGQAWTGKSIGPFKSSRNINLQPGDVVIKSARRFHGARKGTPDMLGITSLFITPDMVGRKAAIFTAVEAKTGKLKATQEQLNYIKMVQSLGGIACVAREWGAIVSEIIKFKQGD